MYKFDHYTEKDLERVIDFMKANPFVTIIGKKDKYPVATQIPVEVSIDATGRITLMGHIMRKTDHQLAFEQDPHVLVLFNGPHCYVSASWYTTPLIGSTWNYMTVQAKGQLSFTDEAGTLAAIRAVSNRFEGTNSIASFDKVPQDYIDHMVKAIVGINIEIESMDNVFKLSQNRDEESRKNIINELKKRGDEQSAAIADEMIKRI